MYACDECACYLCEYLHLGKCNKLNKIICDECTWENHHKNLKYFTVSCFQLDKKYLTDTVKIEKPLK